MTASLCFQDSIQITSIVRSPDILIVCDIYTETGWPTASAECLFLTPTNFVPVTRPTGTATKKQPILIHDLGLLSFLRFRSSLSLDMKTLGESLPRFGYILVLSFVFFDFIVWNWIPRCNVVLRVWFCRIHRLVLSVFFHLYRI